ncbi:MULTISPECIES: hypothetical protein [Oerskovia]|uniref:DUF779 domain-containing protein n=2 Tax=Oerskovia TaxID=162491 RepID=A0ABW1XEE8_9CELL|nr:MULTISPECIES: hypothetical protein [Oerskovia]MBM7496713.1 hypothetical protein [Oerskovia paurometabola]
MTRTTRMPRPLTDRERSVLDALLSIDVDGVSGLRRQARSAVVTGTCGCGCPSIDFRTGTGMQVVVDARVIGSPDGLFLYLLDGELGGIEWVSVAEERPTELPEPAQLEIVPA